jgi:hypothetical protein
MSEMQTVDATSRISEHQTKWLQHRGTNPEEETKDVHVSDEEKRVLN